MKKLKKSISVLQRFCADDELVTTLGAYYKLHIPLKGVIDGSDFYRRAHLDFSTAQLTLLRESLGVDCYECHACFARESLLSIIAPPDPALVHAQGFQFVETLNDAATAYAYLTTPPDFNRRKEFFMLIDALLSGKLSKFMN